jgi:vanillate O-demethylase monooxygenase subunit
MTTAQHPEAAPFLRNAWYVAGWSHEIDEGRLLGRKLLDLPVVLFRAPDGSARALGDRCPHRFAPLHRGVLSDGVLKCGYHGLGFGLDGRCVHNPHGDDRAVRALSVPAYPLVESDGALWIWMGDPERADRDAVPRFECLDETLHHVGRGYLHGDAQYELMVDNILDLSHVEFLHPNLGTPEVSRAKVDVTRDGDDIVSARRMAGETLPPGLAAVYRTQDRPVDRTMEVRWQAPANLLLSIRIDHADGAPIARTGSQSLHLFTPETAHSTHYFFTGSLARDVADQELFDRFFAALTRAFMTEDKPMIDAQQAMLGDCDIMSLRPALLPIDKAAVLARRTLERLIQDERASLPAAEPTS